MHDRGKNYYDNNDTLKIMVKLTMILCDKNYGGDSEDDCYQYDDGTHMMASVMSMAMTIL